MKPLTLILKLFVLSVLLNSCKKDDNPPAKSWKTLAPMPTARYDLGFVECNNLLYAIGGYNADAVNKVEVYDPVKNNWQTKSPMPTARGYLVVAAVLNKIYAIGGIKGGDLNNITYTNVTEEYDPATDKWTVKAPLPISAIPPNSVLGNQFITGAAINNKIYVATGSSAGNAPTFVYDPSTDNWSNVGSPIPKFNFEPSFSTAINDEMYVTVAENFLQYLSANNEWRLLQPLLNPRSNACLVASDGKVYSIGGLTLNYQGNNGYEINVSTNVEAYDIASGSWAKTASLNAKRHSAASVAFNNNIYVTGGAVRQANFSDVPISTFEVLSLK